MTKFLFNDGFENAGSGQDMFKSSAVEHSSSDIAGAYVVLFFNPSERFG